MDKSPPDTAKVGELARALIFLFRFGVVVLFFVRGQAFATRTGQCARSLVPFVVDDDV